MDRASVFSDDEVIELLEKRFIPVAVDEWYHVRRKDAEGDLYRKVVYQREGLDPKEDRTTQGLYIFHPDGRLIRGWNNRDAAKVKRFLKEALEAGAPSDGRELPAAEDPRFARSPGEGGIVVDVFTRVVEADWTEARDEWQAVSRAATGRDHLWIREREAGLLAGGKMPEELARRIARFHLVDNTRGEPPHWSPDEIRGSEWRLIPDGPGRYRIEGRIALATKNQGRWYEASLGGLVESQEGKLRRFDLVARGRFHGEGRYTRGAPPGKFTLGIAFQLAEGPDAARVPPQGARDFAEYYGKGR
jgi:hypothetical protein